MPKLKISEEYKLTTRSKYTTVDCILGIELTGNELPNMAVVGEALEQAALIIQASISESYTKVPERV